MTSAISDSSSTTTMFTSFLTAPAVRNVLEGPGVDFSCGALWTLVITPADVLSFILPKLKKPNLTIN